MPLVSFVDLRVLSASASASPKRASRSNSGAKDVTIAALPMSVLTVDVDGFEVDATGSVELATGSTGASV